MGLNVSAPAGRNGDGEAPDWKALKKEVISRLDIRKEYEEMGVKMDRPYADKKGFIPCYGLRPDGDPDTRASACINVLTGSYLDKGVGDESTKFFDFAMREKKFGSFIETFRHFADKVGVPVLNPIRREQGIVEAYYNYRDADGKVPYRTVRYIQANGGKTFRQNRWDGIRWDGTSGCMKGVQPLPYRFPELLASAEGDICLFVEGEKNADHAAEFGFIATTNHEGGQNWEKTGAEFLHLLPARDYVVIPDNDPIGKRHAAKVADALHGHLAAIDPCWAVKVVTLPDMPKKGDLSDFFDMGGTAEELRALIAAAPAWVPGTTLDTPATEPDEPTEKPRRIYATLADAVRVIGETRWVWEPWIPSASMTLLAAVAGVGKTRTAMELVRRLWLGLPWPDGAENRFPDGTKTLWILPDRNWGQTSDVATSFGIPLEAIILNSLLETPLVTPELDDPETIMYLTEQVMDVKPGLVVIDTITYATARNTARSEEAKVAFDGIMQMAAETGVGVFALAHLNKQGEVLNRRITERARSVISLSRPDPRGQPERRRFWVSKTAVKEPPPMGITFKADCNEFDLDPPEESEKSHEPSSDGQVFRKGAECVKWLRTVLEAGTQAVEELMGLGEEEGFSRSTVYRAKDKLNINVFDLHGQKHWQLNFSD